MNTRVLVVLSLFVAMGLALHGIIPPIFGGMKPDMMLTMMFLGILLFPHIRNVFLLGAVTGVLSGLTTSFPGGLLPNVIDKIVTAFVFYLLVLMIKKYASTVAGAGVLTAVGTLVSGTVFLTAAFFIVGLPGGAGFTALFLAVVLPAVAMNTVAMVFIYPIVQTILKRSKIALN
ncbi:MULTISPECIES: tryptophan transporter [Metabacillus]|uniref:Tryptophan transporter n=1 Tax=Metabacillus indicus TaxID=246786 RepID=A0A084GJ75_METID|nr:MULTISPECIES: tryptophan transporter [Metabacillus]KEZ47085.1 tryptophan transporter [Metabacillus indicus LMG 22858]KEZ47387.1 tryptophan transporter [Metabacillus indicus]